MLKNVVLLVFLFSSSLYSTFYNFPISICQNYLHFGLISTFNYNDIFLQKAKYKISMPHIVGIYNVNNSIAFIIQYDYLLIDESYNNYSEKKIKQKSNYYSYKYKFALGTGDITTTTKINLKFLKLPFTELSISTKWPNGEIENNTSTDMTDISFNFLYNKYFIKPYFGLNVLGVPTDFNTQKDFYIFGFFSNYNEIYFIFETQVSRYDITEHYKTTFYIQKKLENFSFFIKKEYFKNLNDNLTFGIIFKIL